MSEANETYSAQGSEEGNFIAEFPQNQNELNAFKQSIAD